MCRDLYFLKQYNETLERKDNSLIDQDLLNFEEFVSADDPSDLDLDTPVNKEMQSSKYK